VLSAVVRTVATAVCAESFGSKTRNLRRKTEKMQRGEKERRTRKEKSE
jgi:hypothetical protein